MHPCKSWTRTLVYPQSAKIFFYTFHIHLCVYIPYFKISDNVLLNSSCQHPARIYWEATHCGFESLTLCKLVLCCITNSSLIFVFEKIVLSAAFFFCSFCPLSWWWMFRICSCLYNTTTAHKAMFERCHKRPV